MRRRLHRQAASRRLNRVAFRFHTRGNSIRYAPRRASDHAEVHVLPEQLFDDLDRRHGMNEGQYAFRSQLHLDLRRPQSSGD